MKFMKAALLGLALVGLFSLPMEPASARTRCNVTTVNGHVFKRVCTTTRTYGRGYRPYRHAYRSSYRPYRDRYYRYHDRPYYRSYHRHNRFWNDY